MRAFLAAGEGGGGSAAEAGAGAGAGRLTGRPAVLVGVVDVLPDDCRAGETESGGRQTADVRSRHRINADSGPNNQLHTVP